ncbi:hypothetical protein ACFO5K_11160 [Nocardia halotolerans]|uniref:Anti-sigma-K factor RskA N-terminal domain-containing protein n=1 Tax=Nocardia halotolerans TaxID=1755878 RepID=A0ABV8VFX1_9NOCA
MNGQRGSTAGRRGTGAPEIRSGAEDREQLRALYRDTGAAAFGLALRVLHRRGAAEEVVREGYRQGRAIPWITGDDSTCEESDPIPTAPVPHPDLGTPWGRAAFVANEPRTDLDPGSPGAVDVAFGRGIVYGPAPEARTPAPEPGHPTPFTPEQSSLLARVHRLAVQRLRLDRHDGDHLPWLAASARLGFDDPLDSHCEVFVLAYYGGRTYRAIGRELGLRVPAVTRLLAEGIERLAERHADTIGAGRAWSPPGSILALADAYALDAVAELEHHHIENKLTAVPPNGLAQFASRVRGVHEVLARLAAADQRTPPRHLENRILADLNATESPPRRGHRVSRPPWLRRFGGYLAD